MYIEGELFLSLGGTDETVRVLPPSWSSRVVHLLTFGRGSAQWERESFEPRQLVTSLYEGVLAAGITNVISIAADDEILFRDDRRAPMDLAAAFETLGTYADGADERPATLELVAEHADDVATYILSVNIDRVHPVDRVPVRVHVYGLVRDFDVSLAQGGGYRGTAVSASGRVEGAMRASLRDAEGFRTLVTRVEDGVVELCRRLEQTLRQTLKSRATQASIRVNALRPQQGLEYEATALREGADTVPLLRPYPGLREATFYLRQWLPLLHELGASLTRTTIVDEGGRPVFHINREPIMLAKTTSVLPEGPITEPTGALDVLYFAGNDYEQELRAAHRLSDSSAAQGELAWDQIRARELDVRHEHFGFGLLGAPNSQRAGGRAGSRINLRSLQS